MYYNSGKDARARIKYGDESDITLSALDVMSNELIESDLRRFLAPLNEVQALPLTKRLVEVVNLVSIEETPNGEDGANN